MRRAFLLSISLALAAFVLLPMPGMSEQLSSRIGHQRNKVAQKLHHEGVLTTTISSFNDKISGLQGSIRGLQRARDQDPDHPVPEARRARRHPEQAPGGTRPPRAAQAAAGGGEGPAFGAAGGRLRVRRSGHRHRDPRGARLRRPPHARRLPRADLEAGPADRRHREDAEGPGNHPGEPAHRPPGQGAGRGKRDPQPAQRGGGLEGPARELAGAAPERARRPQGRARPRALQPGEGTGGPEQPAGTAEPDRVTAAQRRAERLHAAGRRRADQAAARAD